MEFAKAAEQQVFQRVQDCTARFRRGDAPENAVIEVLRRHGVDIDRSVFPCFGELDEGVYSGTVVNQHRRVLEFVIDAGTPAESTLDDVTDQLGPKDPHHPRSDVKDVITMSLYCFDRNAV